MPKSSPVPDSLGPSRAVEDQRNWGREKAQERADKREDTRSLDRYYTANFPKSPLAKPR